MVRLGLGIPEILRHGLQNFGDRYAKRDIRSDKIHVRLIRQDFELGMKYDPPAFSPSSDTNKPW